MWKYAILSLICLLVLATPALLPVVAADPSLVAPPCVPGEGGCPDTAREAARYGTCEFVATVQNVIRFILVLTSIVVTILFVYAGLRLVVSGGDTGARDKAKLLLTNVVIGLFLVIASYAIITQIIIGLVPEGSKVLQWDRIQCIYPVVAVDDDLGRGRVTAVPEVTERVLSETEAAGLAGSVESYRSALCGRAAAAGIAGECNNLLALMSVESGGRPAVVSGAGAVGLMQMLPGTARGLDPALAGLSNAQIAEKLKDPNYNMDLGVKYYAQLKREFTEDRLVFAAYNGGPGANGPSRDCPGLRRWECEWDNPEHTRANVGYRETRRYVVNLGTVARTFE